QLWQQTLNWQPTADQQCQFQRLYELTLEGNRQLNLTRITAPLEFWEKHLWDSLRGVAPRGPIASLQKDSELKQQVIDIGTGAGFPGIPVAIALGNWTVTLLDSTRKKMTFLQKLLVQLGIQNATTVVGRAESIGQQPQYRQTYDVALIRAVGSVSVCAEYTLPLLKIGGLAVLYRGHWTDNDAEALQSTVEQLGGVIESTEEFTTPLSQSIRHCLYLRKVASTSAEFPRPVGIPAQQPLQRHEVVLGN
nr:16S rRNA (guanine(527)-N(7))-methyltransferase RsmG [Nostocaceae cyanobacterium]